MYIFIHIMYIVWKTGCNNPSNYQFLKKGKISVLRDKYKYPFCKISSYSEHCKSFVQSLAFQGLVNCLIAKHKLFNCKTFEISCKQMHEEDGHNNQRIY